MSFNQRFFWEFYEVRENILFHKISRREFGTDLRGGGGKIAHCPHIFQPFHDVKFFNTVFVCNTVPEIWFPFVLIFARNEKFSWEAGVLVTWKRSFCQNASEKTVCMTSTSTKNKNRWQILTGKKLKNSKAFKLRSSEGASSPGGSAESHIILRRLASDFELSHSIFKNKEQENTFVTKRSAWTGGNILLISTFLISTRLQTFQVASNEDIMVTRRPTRTAPISFCLCESMFADTLAERKQIKNGTTIFWSGSFGLWNAATYF